ncbi:MAG TPA: hypothetical protein VFS00_18415 [Polyangiaceae bacterium]|nr:hypothetical protein [Polyangiaceae bacterium]
MSSFLSKAGAVVGTVIKHVPGRGVLWGAIGFAVGLAAVGLSFALREVVLDRGGGRLGYFLIIPIALPFLGAALFATHGLHRGAARAALELEQRFGLVRHVVDRIMGLLIRHLGGPLSNLPLQRVEEAMKAAIGQYSMSEDVQEGAGLGAWVVRRGKLAITRRIDTYLLTAYRAEQRADGSGGGVSLERVGERVGHEMSTRLGEIVMGPLNQQLAIFMVAYVVLAGGWWYWLSLIVRLVGAAAGTDSPPVT